MTALDNNSPWPGPKGMIPVTSGRPDDANVITRRYLDQILVEMRAIDSTMPELTTEIFGRQYSTPLMMPAFSHLNKVLKEGRKPMNEYAEVAREMNMLNWVGMESDEDYADIVSCGAPTVRIIKPFKDHDLILEQIAFAEKHGAVAVGVDIDHVPGKNGQYDAPDGMQLGPVMLEDLKQYVEAAHVPFVAKGVLSVQDALKCRDAGCKAVLVSHHHGRLAIRHSSGSDSPYHQGSSEGKRNADLL
jgi:4-hydroxymandelate oxidase